MFRLFGKWLAENLAQALDFAEIPFLLRLTDGNLGQVVAQDADSLFAASSKRSTQLVIRRFPGSSENACLL